MCIYKCIYKYVYRYIQMLAQVNIVLLVLEKNVEDIIFPVEIAQFLYNFRTESLKYIIGRLFWD